MQDLYLAHLFRIYSQLIRLAFNSFIHSMSTMCSIVNDAPITASLTLGSVENILGHYPNPTPSHIRTLLNSSPLNITRCLLHKGPDKLLVNKSTSLSSALTQLTCNIPSSFNPHRYFWRLLTSLVLPPTLQLLIKSTVILFSFNGQNSSLNLFTFSITFNFRWSSTYPYPHLKLKMVDFTSTINRFSIRVRPGVCNFRPLPIMKRALTFLLSFLLKSNPRSLKVG